jgi:nicotinamide-nucleotide amidase
MTCHLLTIGDEILIGQIVDTNSAWMSQQLNLRGIRVTGKSSVGDTHEAIIDGIRQATRHADVVIMTGGLGPTKDDITKKTLAELFGANMVLDEVTYQRIEGYFTKIQRPMPPTMHEQATLPDKATILTNKVGTAPGMWFDEGGKVYVSLPGVPFEMEYLMTAEVMPRLVARFEARPIVHRTILTACEGESMIAQRIEAIEDALPSHIKLAYLPGLGQVRLRLTGIWPTDPIPPEAEALLSEELEQYQNQITAVIPELIYGYEEDTLPAVVGRSVAALGWKLATAESCTGGYIAHQLTAIPGASAWYPGSIVAYSYEMKERWLGVSADTLAQHGAVSEATVIAMAQGTLDAFDVDIAVSVSGIAGPDGGTHDKPVGTVWIAVATRQQVVTQKQVFGRDRLKNIMLTSTYALNLVRKVLEGVK